MKNKFGTAALLPPNTWSGIIGWCLFVSILAGCLDQPAPILVTSTSETTSPTATIPIPSETSTFSPSPTTTETATPAVFTFMDLDQIGVWSVYEEGAPQWLVSPVSEPALDGNALQCSLTGGQPYSNAHCYQNLTSVPDASGFTLSLSFWFSPTTTCNNQASPSIIQALEFSLSKWLADQRFEFALQWQNVGTDAPQWKYWDPTHTEKWLPLLPPVRECLHENAWNTLELQGEILDGQAIYHSFTINDQLHNMNIAVPAVSTPGEIDRLAVAIQLDGNANQTPYDVYIDQVNLFLQLSP